MSSNTNTNTNTNNALSSCDPMLHDIMHTIEVKTENKVKELLSTNLPHTPNPSITMTNALTNIMKSGAQEFEEKTGRPMTYSEMRAMFG